MDQLRPDRVILLFVTSLNQVALRVAARQRGIETVHLEHGYRVPLGGTEAEELLDEGYARGLRTEPARALRTHLFFLGTLLRARSFALLRYGVEVLGRGVSIQLLREWADLRRTDRYVSFSKECFDYHEEVDQLRDTPESSCDFVGVPQFERLVAAPTT